MADRASRAVLVSGLLLLLSEMAFCVSGAQITITIHNDAPIPQNVLEQATLSNVVYYFKGQRSSGLLDKADHHLLLAGKTTDANPPTAE